MGVIINFVTLHVFPNQKSTSSHPEWMLFWGGLVLCPLLWIFFFFTAIIKLSGEWAVSLFIIESDSILASIDKNM